MADPDNEGLLPLDQVVQELREQILKANAGSKDSELRFRVDSIDIELRVVAQREVSGNGKISFKVLGTGVEAGGGGKAMHENSQKITLSLTPLRPEHAKDSDYLINRKS